MHEGERVAVVIPAYKVEGTIVRVVAGVPPWVDHVVVVDDASPDRTSELVRGLSDPRVRLLRHEVNLGVGGAMTTGYRAALELGAALVVKMDGDGQMDPARLPQLLAPLVARRADYAKGNRFYDFHALRRMPAARRWGNMGLTFLAKVASGYWNISDPTNGYTAIRREALSALNLDAVHPRYFFEISMLINLNVVRAVVVDLHMPAIYGDEKSSMSLAEISLTFPFRLFAGLVRRVYWRYFFYDLTETSVFLASGLLLMGLGTAFGLWRWYVSITTDKLQSTGTIFLAALPFILGFQLFLQAVVLDIHNRPGEPISNQPPGE
ncbi:MAG: glycosyltransferase family 2 protein [Planctomycetes bacterium]|nr:glycosyltransferase family 2 protein [Planctomycetota bacterium]